LIPGVGADEEAMLLASATQDRERLRRYRFLIYDLAESTSASELREAPGYGVGLAWPGELHAGGDAHVAVLGDAPEAEHRVPIIEGRSVREDPVEKDSPHLVRPPLTLAWSNRHQQFILPANAVGCGAE
jgi:hypothetical protein